MKKIPTPRAEYWIALVLIAVTMAVFAGVLQCGFVQYDDPQFVTSEPKIRGGLSWNSVSWAFTDKAEYWIPLTRLSHLMAYQLCGLEPSGHHAINLLFHILNTLLLFGVLRKMTHTLWRSALVAALFAVHPLHVESVAWVTERKDVLSTFFCLWTIWAYVSYSQAYRSTTKYALIGFAFASSLMSKPTYVTLPIVLLFLDYWPLERWKKEKWIELVIEKIPFLAIAGICSVVTLLAQTGCKSSFQQVSISMRISNAIHSYASYIGKMFWPVNLSFYYPHPLRAMPVGKMVIAGSFLMAVSFLVWWQRKKRPYLPVGWLWYVVSLVPMIGLVQVGGQAMADRYTYVSLVGLFLMVVWGAGDMAQTWRVSRFAMGAGVTLLLLALCIRTISQVGIWRDSVTLFSHAIAVTPENWIAQANLGHVLAGQGKTSEGIVHFQKAVRLAPHDPSIHSNLAILLANQGKTDEAMRHFSEALEHAPGFAEAHLYLGILLDQQGNLPKATAHFFEAVRCDPQNAEAHVHLGVALAEQGRLCDAISHFSEALRLEPGNVDASANLGLALARLKAQKAN